MRRMVLHIGYPKTGSSSLQRFLFKNRESLAELGVLYPMAESDVRVAQHNIAWSLSTGYRFDPSSLTFDSVADLFRESEQEVVVISSEDFIQRPDPEAAVQRVRQFATEAEVAVDVIVFVRPQYAYINSLYTQRAKFFNEPRQFREFADKAVNLPLVDYSAHLREWDQGAGMRLIPIPFTADRLQPNLETAFCEAAELTDRLGELLASAERDRMNPAPGPLTVEVCRRLAQHLVRARGGARGIDPAVHGALSRYVLRMATRMTGATAAPFNGLDNDLRDRIDERFAESNEVFARRYWDASWREVFAKDYERDLIPNEFDRASAEPRDRRAVRAATRRAVERANTVLDGRPGKREDRRAARSRGASA